MGNEVSDSAVKNKPWKTTYKAAFKNPKSHSHKSRPAARSRTHPSLSPELARILKKSQREQRAQEFGAYEPPTPKMRVKGAFNSGGKGKPSYKGPVSHTHKG